MKLNTEKTNYILFHKKYQTAFNHNQTLSIQMNSTEIKHAINPILLGITLDKHLNFIEHFKSLTKSLNPKINLIKILSTKHYNINRQHLLTIYKSLILSKLQYSMFPYLTTTKYIRNKIQVMQNRILKTILKVPFFTRLDFSSLAGKKLQFVESK